MTKEKAIEYGNFWLKMNDDSKNSITYKFFQMAIKSLKQWDILDKIRAEISYKQEIELKGEDTSEWNECIKEVLEVIDKYIAEREAI